MDMVVIPESLVNNRYGTVTRVTVVTRLDDRSYWQDLVATLILWTRKPRG